MLCNVGIKRVVVSECWRIGGLLSVFNCIQVKMIEQLLRTIMWFVELKISLWRCCWTECSVAEELSDDKIKMGGREVRDYLFFFMQTI